MWGARRNVACAAHSCTSVSRSSPFAPCFRSWRVARAPRSSLPTFVRYIATTVWMAPLTTPSSDGSASRGSACATCSEPARDSATTRSACAAPTQRVPNFRRGSVGSSARAGRSRTDSGLAMRRPFARCSGDASAEPRRSTCRTRATASTSHSSGVSATPSAGPIRCTCWASPGMISNA